MNLEIIITICIYVVIAAVIALAITMIVMHVRANRKHPHHKCSKHTANPIMSPRPHNEWEANGTFNPAAVADDEGKVHLLYRTIGIDGLSRIGHATSKNGTKIDSRSTFPVYHPEPDCGIRLDDTICTNEPKEFNTTVYTSGGGWGGSEDPRAVLIDDTVYMTYTAFEGWNSVRIALTSIPLKNMKSNKWTWKRTQIISPKGQVNKNWVLFPERINGKFAILHAVSPDVKIEYADSLDNFRLSNGDKTIKSISPKGGRKDFWDNNMRGAGPPPIKTDLGWLLLYHSMDKNDPDKYKVGAMILDSNNPEKVIYRSPKPIMEPEFHYENDGKPGVVYASGAVIKDGELYVYYGGGDKHVCVAKTPLDDLLNWMKKYGGIKSRK